VIAGTVVVVLEVDVDTVVEVDVDTVVVVVPLEALLGIGAPVENRHPDPGGLKAAMLT
jgi:hypothetical protein